jgi:hypothetical protein
MWMHPVQDMRMFNSTEEDFRGCRWTSGGEISLIDGIAQVFGCSKKEARTKLARFMEASPEVNTKRVNLWKFPGAGQRDTPVGPFHEFLELCSQLPGAPARAMRKEQVEIHHQGHRRRLGPGASHPRSEGSFVSGTSSHADEWPAQQRRSESHQ